MKDASNDPVEADFSDVIEKAPAVIYLKDAAGRYLYVNKQYEAVTGIRSERVLGQTDMDLFPAPIAAVFRKEDLQVLGGVAPLRLEEPVVFQGRERLFSTTKVPVPGENGKEAVGVFGISIDITEEVEEAEEADAAQQSKADAFFGRLLDSLTPQEVRVLDLVAAGLSDREIAAKLDLAGDTVRHHVSHLLKKLRKRRAQVIIEMLKRDRA